ncbi:MAG: diaminopropionate ammonia-lyase [Pseudomonadota bacterium]
MTKLFFNPAAAPSPSAARHFNRADTEQLRALFAHAPGFAPTPLKRLERTANRLGVGEIWAKDERNRWGQGSFKSLGGAYAVVSLAAKAMSVPPAAIFAGSAPKAADLTVVTATAGNHGRAVAFGAKLTGARAVIFVYGDVPKSQVAAIAALGAEIVAVPGNYEAACDAVRTACEKHRWIMVSDVAGDGYTDIPERIMRGYCVLAAEAMEQSLVPPTHLFLQAGVGGMAAPVAAYFANVCSPPPIVTVVEAATVPCLMESARNNAFTRTESSGPTNMNRLDCPTPSSTTWPLLRGLASAFVAVENDVAAEAAGLLADENLATTPTGAAGLAGLLALAATPGAFERLGLGAQSRVLIVVTEQAIPD